eukprot:1154523-Pelagomonas_calceolata.AAC.1
MALPLGRNHTPPEVLLRQGAESGWVPQPDCLETPSTAVLEGSLGWVPDQEVKCGCFTWIERYSYTLP